MKVVMLSHIDYAGSAYKLFEAIRRHGDIDISLYSGKPDNSLNHPLNVIVNDANKPAVQHDVNTSDS